MTVRKDAQKSWDLLLRKKLPNKRVWLNTDHPHFDLLLEILATIPRIPSCALLSSLTYDFNVRTQMDLRNYLTDIRDRFGTDLLIVRNKGVMGPGRSVSLDVGPLTDVVEELCSDYLDRVWEQRVMAQVIKNGKIVDRPVVHAE